MYSAPSELILNECCSQIACRSGVVVVHAQLHTLYELILWASQCPARVDIGSSGGEGWSGGLVHSFLEWKVNWKCLDIEIESEKWNENVSKSRSRVKSELKMPRDRDREVKFLENFREILRNSWESRDQENFKFCYKCFSFRKLLLWNTTKCYFWINMSQGILGMVLGWDM